MYKIKAAVFLFLLLSFHSIPLFAYGRLTVSGSPFDAATHITIDGAEILSAPPWPLEAGRHKYTIVRAGYEALSGEVDIPGGNEVALNFQLLPKFPTAGGYFKNIPQELQRRGRWLTLEPGGVGFMAKAGIKPQLILDLARLELLAPKAYLPIEIGLLPVRIFFEPRSGQLAVAAIRSHIYGGAFWTGFYMLISGGLFGFIGGQLYPSYELMAGGGLYARLGFYLGTHFLLNLRYEFDIARSPGHHLLLEWQINLYGRGKR